jgi:hypothetical protein
MYRDRRDAQTVAWIGAPHKLELAFGLVLFLLGWTLLFVQLGLLKQQLGAIFGYKPAYCAEQLPPELCEGVQLLDRCGHVDNSAYGFGALNECASSNTTQLLSCIGSRVQCAALPADEVAGCIGDQAQRLSDYLDSQDGPSTRLFTAQISISYGALALEVLFGIGCLVVHAAAAARRYGKPHLFSTSTLAMLASSRFDCARMFAHVPVRQWVG